MKPLRQNLQDGQDERLCFNLKKVLFFILYILFIPVK
jgi:hypothetical protein